MKRLYVFGTRGFPNVQGGVEKHCEQLYPELSDKYHITIFRRKAFLPVERDGELKLPFQFINLPSTHIKGFESFYHSFLCTLYCIIKRPDLVHIHNIGPGMFIPLLKLTRIKTILTYHSPNYEHQKWNFLAKKILKASEWLATNWADAIIFVNKKQVNRFKTAIRNKSTYIPNGVHIQSRTTATDRIEKLGIQPNHYVLAVGRITQEKGLDYLIDAFLQSKHKNIKLVLAGGIDHASSYAKKIIDKAKNTDIIMAGYADGEYLRQLYSNASLFVLSSYNEGFPLVLLEAMSYHLPLLASDIPANKQLNLDNDSYFETGNISELANKLTYKLSGTNSVSYDLSEYTWTRIAYLTNTVYRKVLD